ncbi:hypothetical protein ABTM19_20445, partial [Acinetobacter baumannii]
DLFGNVSQPTPAKKKVKSVVTPKSIVVANEEIKIIQPAKTKGKRGRKSNKEMYLSADLINIPDDATLDQKLYYSISEVATWFNMNTS